MSLIGRMFVNRGAGSLAGNIGRGAIRFLGKRFLGIDTDDWRITDGHKFGAGGRDTVGESIGNFIESERN